MSGAVCAGGRGRGHLARLALGKATKEGPKRDCNIAQYTHSTREGKEDLVKEKGRNGGEGEKGSGGKGEGEGKGSDNKGKVEGGSVYNHDDIRNGGTSLSSRWRSGS